MIPTNQPDGPTATDYRLSAGAEKVLGKSLDELNRHNPGTPAPDTAADDDLASLDRLFKSGAWLARQDFPPLQWAVQDLIPEGYGLLVAPPKAGKSWLCTELALAVCQGRDTLGGVRTTMRPVLYLALEDGDRRMQARCRQLEGTATIPRQFEYVTNAKTTDVALALISRFYEIHAANRPFIILDTLGKVVPPKTAGDDMFGRDYKFGSLLQQFTKNHPGSTLLAVHHNNKGEHDDFLNSVSGTQGVTAACDFIAVLKRNRGSEKGILQVTGRDVPELEYALTKADNGGWTVDGGSLAAAAELVEEVKADEHERAQLARQGDRTNQILALFSAADFATRYPNGIAPAAVAEEVDISNDVAGQYLRRCVKKGQIRKAGRGTYYPLSEVSEVYERQVRGDIPFGHSPDVSETVRNDRTPLRTVSETSGGEKHALTSTSYTSDTSDTGYTGETTGPTDQTILDALDTEFGLSPETVAGSVPGLNRADAPGRLEALAAAGLVTVDHRNRYTRNHPEISA